MRSLSVGPMALAAAMAVAATLAGCAQPPSGPTVTAVPGPRKSYAEFQQDNSYCMAFAQSQVRDGQQADPFQAISTIGSDAAAYASANMQQRYNSSFAQCMFTKGDSVPGMTPSVATSPASGSSFDPLVRSIQSELVRTGYLSGGVDGSYGPRTRSAILAFENANGMGADATASNGLLARLRAAPSASGGSVAAVGGLVAPVTGGGKGAGQPGLTQPVSSPPVSNLPDVSSPAPAGSSGALPAPSGLVAPVTGGGAAPPAK